MLAFFKKRKYKEIIKVAEELRSQRKLEEASLKYLEAFNIIININDYINLACVYVDMMEYDKAIHIFEDVVGISQTRFVPEMGDIYFGLGLCHDCLHQNSLAIDNYEKAISEGCKLPEVFYFLGSLYDDMELPEEDPLSKKAIELYNKALEVKEDYLFAFVNLGNIYGRFCHYDESLDYFLKAYALDKDDKTNSCYNLGVAYTALNDLDNAEKFYLKEIECESPYKDTYYNLGILYKDKKEYDKSKIYYLKAIEQDKEDYNAWYNLACLYALMNDFDNAFECLTYIKYNKPKYLKTCEADKELDELRKDQRYLDLLK